MAKLCYISFSFFFLSLLTLCSSTITHHDVLNPSTVLPTNPTTSPPATFPPVTITPTNPATTFPSTPPATPLPLNPPVTTIPATLTPPVTNPVPNPVTTPVTNPVTQYPPQQSGTVPVVAPPVVTPPVVSNTPTVPGQSWCVAKPGASQLALQQALDYACGIGGADCTQIQQSGNCYSPVSLQNHASFAFNSYYQKNPSPQSCDFGGAAGIVSINPSTGSCIYQTSSSTGTPVGTTPTPSTQTVNQPAPPTFVPAGGGIIGVGTPPAVFNPANPASNTLNNPSSGSAAVYGFDGSPNGNTPTPSASSHLQLHFGHYMVVTFVLQVVLFH